MASMLTTVDNPYNPFTQFDDWFGWDEQMGYHTISYLGRFAYTSPDLSAEDNEKAVEDAIDTIVRLDVRGVYQKITNNDSKGG